MPFRSHRSHRRGPFFARLALAALVASIGAFAFASPASAAQPPPYFLSLGYPGSGEGEVLCKEGSSTTLVPCEEEYESATKLTLVAEPETGSKFLGFWNGEGSASACKLGATKCVFTINEDSFVEALFEPIMPKLTIKYSGGGEGEILCAEESGLPELCEDEYEFGVEITLVPEAPEGFEFAGFKNGTGSAEFCVGLEPCSFILEADSMIEARFEPIMRSLTIGKLGTGQGAVFCDESPCAGSYAQGTEVTLEADPAPGSTFAGWSLEECPGTGLCVITIEGDTSVSATFRADPELPPQAGKVRAGPGIKVKHGRAQVKLSCSGGPCDGTLKLTAKLLRGGQRKSVSIGNRAFVLADGATQTVKVKLSAAALRALVKQRSLQARVGGLDVLAGRVTLRLAH